MNLLIHQDIFENTIIMIVRVYQGDASIYILYKNCLGHVGLRDLRPHQPGLLTQGISK